MQRYLYRHLLVFGIISLIEVFISAVFLFCFHSFTFLKDIAGPVLLIVILAFVIINDLFMFIAFISVSNTKFKNDISSIDIIHGGIPALFDFGKIGMIIVDDNYKVVWSSDLIINNIDFSLTDRDIFEMIPELKSIVGEEINVDKEILTKIKKDKKSGSVERLKYYSKAQSSNSIIKKLNNINYEIKYVKEAHMFVFKDINSEAEQKIFSENHQPALGILSLDNYNELLGKKDDLKLNNSLLTVQKLIGDYAKNNDLMIRKYQVDRFLFICTAEQYNKLDKDNFSIVEEIKKACRSLGEEGVLLTASIGFAVGINDYFELSRRANEALNLALSRGGDQCVLAPFGKNFIFKGGKTEAKSNSDNVKYRTFAASLSALIKSEADKVFIMGHYNADFDAIGSALGIYEFAKMYCNEVKILYLPELVDSSVGNAVVELFSHEETEEMFIDPKKAISMITPSSLLIITDVNRPSEFMNKEIYLKASQIVCIDHHRQSDELIDTSRAKLVNINPSSSSASEIVTEMIHYHEEQHINIDPNIATMLLAGIILDTQNYSNQKTEARTFEAASLLKSFGASTEKCTEFFKEDSNEFDLKIKVLSNVVPTEQQGVKVCKYNESTMTQAAISKCADQGIKIRGVDACFVVGTITRINKDGKIETHTRISARGTGYVNCQFIMEKIGGGGHFSSAAMEFPSPKAPSIKTFDDAVEALINAINTYYESAKSTTKGDEL